MPKGKKESVIDESLRPNMTQKIMLKGRGDHGLDF